MMIRLMLGTCFFLLSVSLQSQSLTVTNLRCAYIQHAIGIDAAPPLSWELHSTRQNVLQTAYRVLVSDDPALLQQDQGNIWDSKKVMAASSIQVACKGSPLLAARKYYWKVMVWDNKGNQSKWSETAQWQMGLPLASDWKGARWIGYETIQDTAVIVPFAHGKGSKEWGARRDVLPMLRKAFIIEKPVKQATAFICGLGQFEMSINGIKTGDHFLDPGWTQYSKHALYVAFDISSQLKKGENAIGVMLGNGFYYIPGERYRKLTGGFDYPKMICRISIEYTDGTTTDLVSDGSWKTAPSGIIFSSIYGGEDYDAGLDQPGWNRPGFDDAGWKQAVITTGPPQLNAQTAAPLRVMESFEPIAKKMLRPGVWLYDLGQNFSGIPTITVNGKKSDTVRIIPAELLNEDSTVNQKASGAPSYYTYILRGGGNESWQPQFSYYGFRYLEVHGANPAGDTSTARLPVLKKIEGLHTRNSAASSGDFTCSNLLFNQTYKLINWAIKSNMASVFTDCPHREKLGWLEETHLVGSSVQYNFDIATLCNKVIRDMMNAQTPQGLVPEIAPEYVHFDEPFRDSPEWGSASIILPWYNYQWYGDRQTLSLAYPMMKKYIAYLQTKATKNILMQGLGDWYDIGPNHPGISQQTPMGVTGTATYYYDLSILTQVARLLGNAGDVRKFKKLSQLVRTSFNRLFFSLKTKEYASGSQASNAMALFMGLVPTKYKNAVVANLVKDIRRRNNALTAGDIGYRYVLRALEDAGRSDVIFDMNSRNDVPGYGFQLAHGATALTESWAALPSVSNNHFMLGHLMEWFYAGLCGIKQAEGSVAYQRIVIRPQPVGDVTAAEASYHSPYGDIKSSWQKKGTVFKLRISIPVNTTAAVYLPGNARPVTRGSGDYTFSTQMK